MEYQIVRDNRNDLKIIENKENLDNIDNIDNLNNIDNIDNIEVPTIPIEIIEMFKKDYKYMAKLLDYKRDATLALLNIYNVITAFDDNFNLKVEKDIKNWWDFFIFTKQYAQIFTRQGIDFYANKNKNNIQIQIIDEKFLGPIIDKIFYKIYYYYLRKFPYWNDPQGKQNDYINIDLKDKTVINNIGYYWNFKGVLFVQDTNYGKSTDGISFKVEFNGTPKFQIVVFDLSQLKYLKKIEKNLKKYIDKIDDKIINQNLKNLYLDLDI